MNVTHFYHVWAGGEWRGPLIEHCDALNRARYDGPLVVGVVGPRAQRDLAVAEITRRCRMPDRVVTAEGGFEQVTLAVVHQHAQQHPEGAVLYMHTKGASSPSRLNAAWRRSMTCALLANGALDGHLRELEDGTDIVGCHWLDRAHFPHVRVPTRMPMIGGNFWLARCDHLAGLKPVSTSDRWQAESWIGECKNTPTVKDLCPGWPGTVPWVTAIGWPR